MKQNNINIYLTLDYELFLLKPGNNIDFSLINPTFDLVRILNKYQYKAIFFVDAGYLFALNKYKEKYAKLENDYTKILTQLKYLESQGHEIGLHVHPHWEDCYYNGLEWKVNLKRFKLFDFNNEEAHSIFIKYYNFLQFHFQNKIISYRAGGWCLEPFSMVKDAMKEAGIFIDSTVVPGAFYKSKTHSYDYRKFPQKDYWRFSEDPSMINEDGFFIEIPCSPHKLSQFYYWEKLINKIFHKFQHRPNGEAIKPSFFGMIKKLMFKTADAISIDANKSNYLLDSFKLKEKLGHQYFCIIGHPKCFTSETYKNIDDFIVYTINRGHLFNTFSKSIFK